MTLSKKLFLATAVFVTTVSSIKLCASQNPNETDSTMESILKPYKKFLVPAFIASQGKYLIPAGISSYIIGRKLEPNHTITAQSLKIRGRLLVALGVVTAAPWYGILVSTGYRAKQIRLNKKIQEKNQEINRSENLSITELVSKTE